MSAAIADSLSADVMLIAHRGVVIDTLRGNSLASLEETIRRGYTHIEVDLRMTKDGHIVCLHDRSLKRTTGVSGYIDRVTLEELYARVSPQIVPTLELFCQTIKGRIELMPDIKRGPRGHEKEFAGKLEGLLSHYGLLEGALFIGEKSIHAFIESRTRVSTGASVEEARRRIEADAKYASTHFVFAHAVDFNAENVKQFQALGLEVVVSINLFHYPEADALEKGLEDVEAMIALGVDGLQIDSAYDAGLVD
jgi:glycerophosphoryl diester phosphodiesterase